MSTTTPKRLTLSLIINLLFHCQMNHIWATSAVRLPSFSLFYTAHRSTSSYCHFLYWKTSYYFRTSIKTLKFHSSCIMHNAISHWPLFTIHRNRQTSNTWMWKQYHNVMSKWCIGLEMRSFTARYRLPLVNLPISILWQIYCFSIEISPEHQVQTLFEFLNPMKTQQSAKEKEETQQKLKKWMKERKITKHIEGTHAPTHPCHLTSTLSK